MTKALHLGFVRSRYELQPRVYFIRELNIPLTYWVTDWFWVRGSQHNRLIYSSPVAYFLSIHTQFGCLTVKAFFTQHCTTYAYEYVSIAHMTQLSEKLPVMPGVEYRFDGKRADGWKDEEGSFTLIVFRLLNNTVTISDYTPSNCKIVNEKITGKGMKGIGSGLIWDNIRRVA